MSRKSLDFEVNILPILDILSVLICFLLLTAVWVQIGTIDTKQAIGDNTTQASGKNPPSMWLTVDKDGSVKVSLRDMPQGTPLETVIPRSSEGVNWARLEAQLQSLKTKWPDLKTGIVQPNRETPYKDVIKLMDQLKQFKFEGVGLSPLG